jgi:hypothetical protein
MDTVFLISSAIYALGAAISALLLYVYADNYRHIRCQHNIGLIIFAFLFLVDNLVSLHQAVFVWPFYGEVALPHILSHVFLQDIIDVVGLSALLYVTWK